MVGFRNPFWSPEFNINYNDCYQSEGGGTVVMEVPGRDEGMGLCRERLVVQGRASPLNLIGSGMYRKVWDCRKTNLEAGRAVF